MELVGEAEEPVVLLRVVEVEDVLGGDSDLADAGAFGFELGERRNALGVGRVLRLRRRGSSQGGEADEQAMPNQREYIGAGVEKNECRMWYAVR
jgi:hypothetical protein